MIKITDKYYIKPDDDQYTLSERKINRKTGEDFERMLEGKGYYDNY